MEPQENSVPVTHDPYEVPEGVRRARAAFIRDFPRLFADRRYRDKYVCYHEDTLVGVNKDALNVVGTIRDHNGNRVILRTVNLWAHPNESGMRDTLADVPPFSVAARRGIAVYPGNSFPGLPILGLRAIADNNLVLIVDGPNREATLRTPQRWWFF